MLKKVGIVAATATVGLLAVVPFAMATENHHPQGDCNKNTTNSTDTGSNSNVENGTSPMVDFQCASVLSNNAGPTSLGSNNDSSDNSTANSNNPNNSTNNSNNPDSSIDNSQDNSEGIKFPGLGG